MCQSRCAMRCAMTYACDQPHRIEAMIRWQASLPRDRCTRSWWLSLIEFAVPVSPKGFSFYIKSSNQTTKRWRILHQRGPSSWHLLTTFPPPWGIPWDWRSTGSRSDRQPTSQVKKLSQDFFCVPRNRVKAALRTKKMKKQLSLERSPGPTQVLPGKIWRICWHLCEQRQFRARPPVIC